MHYWQIRKYDPLIKKKGAQKKIRTWTSIYDIGKFYEGSKFNEEEYLRMENKYVQAVDLYLDFLKIDYLEMMLLNKVEEELFAENVNNYPKCYSKEIVDFYRTLHKDTWVPRDYVEYAIRLSLREDISSLLRKKQLLFINCTYDYYMDIGSNQDDYNIIEEVRNLGLYADLWNHEYQTNLWELPKE